MVSISECLRASGIDSINKMVSTSEVPKTPIVVILTRLRRADLRSRLAFEHSSRKVTIQGLHDGLNLTGTESIGWSYLSIVDACPGVSCLHQSFALIHIIHACVCCPAMLLASLPLPCLPRLPILCLPLGPFGAWSQRRQR